MKDLKYSRQREAVFETLKSRKDHPTADCLYQLLREDFPHISLGTVYRNLSLLADMGEIRRISCGDGIEHYDYDTREHYHFVCKKCGRVMDMNIHPITDFDNMIVSDDIGRVDSHSLVFHGYCKKCYEDSIKQNQLITAKEKKQ